jgi:hypothetical protein
LYINYSALIFLIEKLRKGMLVLILGSQSENLLLIISG